MDKIYSYSCAQWLAMVGTTHFDNQEDDPQDHWYSYVGENQNDQNPKSGKIGEENPW